jgi:hypothetical protein
MATLDRRSSIVPQGDAFDDRVIALTNEAIALAMTWFDFAPGPHHHIEVYVEVFLVAMRFNKPIIAWEGRMLDLYDSLDQYDVFIIRHKSSVNVPAMSALINDTRPNCPRPPFTGIILA